MAQMFCTLKQAADKLETTEAQIETMLDDGILREFRDGSRRLLKVADLAGLTVAASPASNGGHHAQRKAGPPRAELDNEACALPDLEIKLPPSAAVTTKVSPARTTAPQRASRPALKPAGQRQVPPTIVRKPVAARRRRSPPHAAVITSPVTTPRPRPQTYEMSLRQWIWTGLLDDSPLAIFMVFGIVLLGACAVAGAAYLLIRVL